MHTNSDTRHASTTNSDTRHASTTSSDTRHASTTSSDTRHSSTTNSDTRHASTTNSDTRHSSTTNSATSAATMTLLSSLTILKPRIAVSRSSCESVAEGGKGGKGEVMGDFPHRDGDEPRPSKTNHANSREFASLTLDPSMYKLPQSRVNPLSKSRGMRTHAHAHTHADTHTEEEARARGVTQGRAACESVRAVLGEHKHGL